jgi:YihY family inner membrane protein
MRQAWVRLEGKIPMLPSFAAAMSFYFLVSLIPFLIVVSKCADALFSANLLPEIAGLLRDLLPPESRLRPEAVSAAVLGPRGGGLGLASTLIAAWTASSGFNEMARAVHFVFSDDQRPHPGGWTRRIKSLGLLVVWVFAMGAAAVFLVLIPLVRETLSRLGANSALPAALGAAVRYPAAFALLLCAFTVTYAFVPKVEHRPSWRAASAGGFVASACWMATCFVFAYFLPQVWRVSLFHGALSSALATLIWAYCGCWGVLVGACWAAACREP